MGSPASTGGVKEGDVLVSVQNTLVTLMKHCEVVELIRSVGGDTMSLTVERGEMVVPNIAECFPLTDPTQDMTEEERRMYYQEAMNKGLESRLIPKHFTTVGKMKVFMMRNNLDVADDQHRTHQSFLITRVN